MPDDTELWLARKQQDANPDWGLFAPAARTSDPVTSKKGEAHVRPRRGSQALKILQQYADAELTDEEAVTRAGIPGGWKRCSDLRQKGFIQPTGQLRQSSAGVAVQVCRITPPGRAQL